jgi:ubiquinone/menaquinone biosynthesis C-methylase UbiE
VNLSEHMVYWDGKARARCRVENGIPYVKGDMKRWESITELLIKYIRQHDRVLEIGGGSGTVAVNVFNSLRGIKYLNMDVSPVFADFVGNSLGFPSMVGDARNIPCIDNVFDAVWMLDVVEHIPPIYRTIVCEEVDRVLKYNGAIFINNPTFTSKHDQNFEWILGDIDLLNAFKNFRIHQKVTYEIMGAVYEFIVMTRGI